MTAYPLQNQTALQAGDKQPVHRYITLAQQPGTGVGLLPNVLLRGTMLGMVPVPNGSPDGTQPTFLLSKKTATDGSQDPVCVLAADTDASAGALVVPAYFDGEFAFERMYVDASWTFDSIVANLTQKRPGWYCRKLGILG